MSRPSSYNEETAEAICSRMAEGQSLREVCRDANMPSKATVLRWLRERPAFQAQYARARDDLLAHWEAEILEISDDGSNDWMSRQQGEETIRTVDHEHISRSKLRVDSRKWLMSKLAPKKYGDRIEVEQTVEHRFVARIPEPAANASEWLADQKPKQIEGTAVSSLHRETGEKISKPR